MLANDDKNSVLCEASGSKREGNAYSPYGYSTGGEGALGYNGERREAQVDYVLGNGYRTFSLLLMRFRSPDSWSPFGEGGLNAYMYVMGNPIEFADETGHAPGWLSRIFRRIFGNKAKAASNASPKFKATPSSKTFQPDTKSRTLNKKNAVPQNAKGDKAANVKNNKSSFWADQYNNEGRSRSDLHDYNVNELLNSRSGPAKKLMNFDEPIPGIKRLEQSLKSPNSLLSAPGQVLVDKLSRGLQRTTNSSHDLGMVENIRSK